MTPWHSHLHSSITISYSNIPCTAHQSFLGAILISSISARQQCTAYFYRPKLNPTNITLSLFAFKNKRATPKWRYSGKRDHEGKFERAPSLTLSGFARLENSVFKKACEYNLWWNISWQLNVLPSQPAQQYIPLVVSRILEYLPKFVFSFSRWIRLWNSEFFFKFGFKARRVAGVVYSASA